VDTPPGGRAESSKLAKLYAQVRYRTRRFSARILLINVWMALSSSLASEGNSPCMGTACVSEPTQFRATRQMDRNSEFEHSMFARWLSMMRFPTLWHRPKKFWRQAIDRCESVDQPR